MNGTLTRTLTLAAALAVSAAVSADDVRLLGSVRLDAGAKLVRLRDIATLEGPDAGSIADTVVARAPHNGRPIRVSINDVRAKLRDIGAPLGRINLSGNVVTVRPRRAGPSVLPPMAVISVAPGDAGARTEVAVPDVPALEATALEHEATMRGAITRHLLRELDLAPEDLRIRFDGADGATLLASSRDQRFELDPQSALNSPVVRLEIRAWRDGLVVSRHEVSFTPLTRVCAATATRELKRNDEVGPADLVFETEWVPVAHARLVDGGAKLIGRVATQLIRAGDRVGPDALRKRTIVERGDEITVRRRVGGVALAVRAEAREDATRDQIIEARRPGDRETFLVRVVGPHEAVIPNERAIARQDQGQE